MTVTDLEIPGLKLIEPKRFGDDRGFFSETFNAQRFADTVGPAEFVQDNHSLSRDVGTLRGLHFQLPPYTQGKLVRVTRGRVLDVAVDLRKGSPTYGKHAKVELSAENWQQFWVPAGFAHAFLTLEQNTEFLYKVTNLYAPDHDSGLRFDDPDLGIDWGMPADQITVSEKDANQGAFKDFDSPFVYDVP